jgi:hypothetical protein
MNNAGVFTLAALPIVTPTSAVITAITGLQGMSAVTLEASFTGTGGTTCSAIVSTGFDGGTTRRQIARFDFTVSSGSAIVKVANLNGLLSKAVTLYADLGVEGVNDGVLGDFLQVSLITTGTYVGGNLSVRASVR